MKPLQKIRFPFGIVFLLTAAFLWGWVLWPTPFFDQEIDLPQFSSTVSDLDLPPLRAHLRYPLRLHAGETAAIRVRLLAAGAVESPPNNGSTQAMVEARVDLPLAQLTPPGGITERFSTGALPHFAWQVTASRAGRLDGQFWLYMLLVGADGQTDRQALLAVPFEIQVQTLLGFAEPVLVWAALAFTLAGLLLAPVLSMLPRLKHKRSRALGDGHGNQTRGPAPG